MEIRMRKFWATALYNVNELCVRSRKNVYIYCISSKDFSGNYYFWKAKGVERNQRRKELKGETPKLV